MPCDICTSFPVPTTNFQEFETSVIRHGTLYKCKACDGFLEVIAEERAPRFLSVEEAKRLYSQTKD